MRHLRYFVAVAEEQHFTRAAQRLHMAQPPLSQAIRQLETELGVELLLRSTRRVELTDAGRAYLEQARAILGSVDAAGERVRRVAAGLVGHLTIGCVGSATYSLLPELSRRLDEALPGIDFSFRGELLAPDQARALGDGVIDIALTRPPVTDLGVTTHLLRRDRLVVALPAGHPLAERSRVPSSALRGVDLIVHSAGRRSVMYDVVLRVLRDAGVEPRIRHEVGETSTLITLVAGGLGAAIVPESVQALRLAGVVYRPLVRPATHLDLVLAHRTDRHDAHLSRAVEVIRDATGTPAAR
nr:LysR substrate-binding domain-containing protein [Flexivirga meconopsidis]